MAASGNKCIENMWPNICKNRSTIHALNGGMQLVLPLPPATAITAMVKEAGYVETEPAGGGSIEQKQC